MLPSLPEKLVATFSKRIIVTLTSAFAYVIGTIWASLINETFTLLFGKDLSFAYLFLKAILMTFLAIVTIMTLEGIAKDLEVDSQRDSPT